MFIRFIFCSLPSSGYEITTEKNINKITIFQNLVGIQKKFSVRSVVVFCHSQKL